MNTTTTTTTSSSAHDHEHDHGSEGGGEGMEHNHNHDHNNMGPTIMDNPQNLWTEEEIAKLHEPWYRRTIPGRSGAFMGHATAAAGFFIPAIIMLLLAWKRARALNRSRTSNATTTASFSDLYIPESSLFILRHVNTGIMIATIGAIYGEAVYEHHSMEDLWGEQLNHQVLYFTFCVVSLCGILESHGKLPPDAWRAAQVVAFGIASLLWGSHGYMKQLLVDQALHYLLALLNFMTCALIVYSMNHYDSIMAYVTSYALMIVQAIYLICVGLYECCIETFTLHQAIALLAADILFVMLCIMMATAFGGIPIPTRGNNNAIKAREEYGLVANQSTDEDGEDDNDENDNSIDGDNGRLAQLT